VAAAGDVRVEHRRDVAVAQQRADARLVEEQRARLGIDE
jgi:hypothetical protein